MVLTESTKTLARSDSKLLRLKLAMMKSFIEISTTRLSIFFNSRNRISRSNRSRSDRFDAPFSKRLSVGKIGRPNRREKLLSRDSPRMSIRKRFPNLIPRIDPPTPSRNHSWRNRVVSRLPLPRSALPLDSNRKGKERKGTEWPRIMHAESGGRRVK